MAFVARRFGRDEVAEPGYFPSDRVLARRTDRPGYLPKSTPRRVRGQASSEYIWSVRFEAGSPTFEDA